MGLMSTDVQLFASLIKAGAELGDLATLGRQFLLASTEACERALRGLPIEKKIIEQFLLTRTEWADELFTALRHLATARGSWCQFCRARS